MDIAGIVAWSTMDGGTPDRHGSQGVLPWQTAVEGQVFGTPGAFAKVKMSPHEIRKPAPEIGSLGPFMGY